MQLLQGREHTAMTAGAGLESRLPRMDRTPAALASCLIKFGI